MAHTLLFNSALSNPQIILVFVKVHLFLDHSCAIVSSFKIVVIFNNTSADFVLISADVLSIENDHNFKKSEDPTTAI